MDDVRMPASGAELEGLRVGTSASYAKTITDADVVLFAGVSGDTNPLHLDEEFAAQTQFRGRIAHGMLTASFISTVIGTRLLPPGGVYLKQSLTFLAPVRIGDTVRARVTVAEILPEKRRAILKTECTVGDTVVVAGEALVLVPKAG